jgi:hypothetical protein
MRVGFRWHAGSFFGVWFGMVGGLVGHGLGDLGGRPDLPGVVSTAFITEICGQLFGPKGLGIAGISACSKVTSRSRPLAATGTATRTETPKKMAMYVSCQSLQMCFSIFSCSLILLS